MSSYKIYRFYSLAGGRNEKNLDSYAFSLVVSNGFADFVVPTFAEQGRLAALRSNMNTAMKEAEKRGVVPSSVTETAQVVASNVGTYYANVEVFSSNDSDDPSLMFSVLREREQDLIDKWVRSGKEPENVYV